MPLKLSAKMGWGQKSKRKTAKYQMGLDKELSAYNAELNYTYGEQAADAAYLRSLGLMKQEREMDSLKSQIADAHAAGASPGLVLSGGAGGGGGIGGGA